jgi:hypothetical protein
VATDLTPVEQPAALEPAQPSARPAARPHRRRFIAIYGLLAAVFVFGLVGTVVWAGRAISPGPAWSAWKPSGGGLGAAKQIAERIGGTYRLPSGFQLVDVIAKEPTVAAGLQQLPLRYIDFHNANGVSDTYLQVSQSNTVTYSLCGAGESCAIATGKPSATRDALLHREVLELALYTFKYVRGIQHVIALMPPGIGQPATVAIYLQKADLREELKRPLATTLSPSPPSTVGGRELRKINRLLKPLTFNFSLAQGQQGDAILVLQGAPHRP